MKLRASIDIGSNSVLLSIIDIVSGSEIETRSFITSLGKDIDKNKKFCDQSIADTYAAISEISAIIKNHNISPESVVMTATEASRVAANANEFFDRIFSDFKFVVSVLNPEGEAYYSSLPIAKGFEQTSVADILIIDIGGASTELTQVIPFPLQVKNTISLAVGSVRATDWLNESTYIDNLNKQLSRIERSSIHFSTIIGIAGTFTTIVTMLEKRPYEECKVEGYNLIKKNLQNLYSQIQNEDVLKTKFSYIGKRTQTIAGGIRLVLDLMDFLKLDTIKISTKGLRHGVLMVDKIEEKYLC